MGDDLLLRELYLTEWQPCKELVAFNN